MNNQGWWTYNNWWYETGIETFIVAENIVYLQ